MNTHQSSKAIRWAGLAAAGILGSGAAVAGPGTMGEYGEVTMTESVSEWVTVDLRFVASHVEMDLKEDYYSEDMVLWHADYDEPEGWLYGIAGAATFPKLRNSTIDFLWQTGELDGDVTIERIAGGEGAGPWNPDADIDRDVWRIGLSVPLFNCFYARAEYYDQEDDVDWDYGEGYIEKQEYELQALRFGVGARQDFPVGDTGLTFTVDGFVGAVYFDLEHDELGDPPNSTDWDGWGYVLRAGAHLSYPLWAQFSAVCGASYEFMDLDDDDLELENHTLDLSVGVTGTF